MPSFVSSRPSRLRLWPERCIFVLLAGVAMRTWYLEGLVVPFCVSGGSMAPALLGSHRKVECGDCGRQFLCGSDSGLERLPATCPNCGHRNEPGEAGEDSPGERLLIHKSIYRLRRPRRWEVVAFRPAHRAGQLHVKRVAGLPGESLRIIGGDVFINGQIQRKTLAQQRALAILVHDANYGPVLDPLPPPRWQAARRSSRWGSDGGRFGHPETSRTEPIDWLEYRHWRRVSGRIEEGPITDLCAYNHTLPRREEDVHAVADLMLSFELFETFGQGMLAIRVSDGREEFQVRIYSEGNRYEVLHNGRRLPAAAGKLPAQIDRLPVEVSLFDRRFLLAFDGSTEVVWPYHGSQKPVEPTSCPLAIGTHGLGVVICKLKVYRDVYYTEPIGLHARWGFDQPVELGPHEYFLLGDNSPISEDSRTWPKTPALPANLLVGKPVLVHFPARWVRLAGWRFQVPELGRIRYIR